MDTARLIKSLLENTAQRDRGVFLFNLQFTIKELIILTPNDIRYKSLIEFPIFLKKFEEFTDVIISTIKKLRNIKNRFDSKGIDKLGSLNLNINYDLTPLIESLKNLLKTASSDYEYFYNKYDLNEHIEININKMTSEDLNIFKENVFDFLYKTLTDNIISIIKFPLHGGDFIIAYDFTKVKEALKVICDRISHDLTEIGNALITSHKMTKEEVLRKLETLKDIRKKEDI